MRDIFNVLLSKKANSREHVFAMFDCGECHKLHVAPICRSFAALSHLQSMTRFVFKNLPKGFSFFLSKKEVREFITNSGAKFRSVTFEGISNSEAKGSVNTGRYWVGILSGKRNDDLWSFSLELNGLRDQNIINVRESVSELLLNEMNAWIHNKLSQPSTSSVQPNKLFLSFVKKSGEVVSACHEVEWK